MSLRKKFRDSLFRYTLYYLVGVSVAVFVVLAMVYASITYGYFRELNGLIEAETRYLNGRYGSDGLDGVSTSIAERIQEVRFPRLFYLLVDADGEKMAGNLAHWPERLGHSEQWVGLNKGLLGWLQDESEYEFIGAWVSFEGGERLVVARYYQDINEFLRITLTVLLQAMLATIILGAISAAILSTILERRLKAINDSIATILSGDLSQRIPVGYSGGGDDYANLIVNFNHMLDRINQLMEGLKQLSDNIAHDLRTPLTRLRNNLASIELDELGNNRDVVAGLIEEADALLATFNALLRIARIESGNKRSAFAKTDMVTILSDVCEFYEPLAADKEQSLVVELPATCPCVVARDLFFQALANLLDNAIKYAPRGGRIEVCVEERDDGICIEVGDNGPGIAAAEREKVFQRFYRVEESRSGHPGNGLGLSLVQAVVNLHGGSIGLGDNEPGLRVSVKLPRAQP
jgi:signal transduction histidine kinase